MPRQTKHIASLLLLLLPFFGKGQFVLNGSAVHSGEGDYLLTPASRAKVGSIWYDEKISLKESFELNFELYFGTSDRGADGIAFCLQPLSTGIGVSGGGLGVGGVRPSFFAEFDTYRNGGDPSFDHVAIQRNGDVHNGRSNNLAPAVQIKAGQNNVEDGQWYPMRAVWDADAKKFDLFVDCVLRVTYTGDIVNTIFGGDPMVYWGFTASTGGAHNEHRVRNVRSTLIKMDDESICKGESVRVNVPATSSTFSWSPTTGITGASTLTPTFSPTTTTEYVITYNGFCGTELKDTVIINVGGAELELGNDTTICDDASLNIDAGSYASYTWSTGARTRSIDVNSSGTYSVTVTDTDGCTTTDDLKLVSEVCVPQVDTFYVCEGQSVVIDKGDFDIADWSGSEPFTKISEGSIEATPSKTTTYYITSYTKNINALVNGDFEQPYRNRFGIISDATVPGWSTTASDRKMEFWNDGFLGTPAYSGVQFVELNANMPAALYQDMATTPGSKLMWGFAHRGRGGVESMHFELGPPGGPYERIETVSTGKSWKYYSGVYEVPAGQTSTRFYYTSAMPGASGNLLDAIEFFTLDEIVDSVIVVVSPLPSLALGNDTTICLEESLSLDAGGPFASYIWSNSATSRSIDVNVAGEYSVTVANAGGCEATDKFVLGIEDCSCDAEKPVVNGASGGIFHSFYFDPLSELNETVLGLEAGEKYGLKVSGTWSVWTNDPSKHSLDPAFRYKEKNGSTDITPIKMSTWVVNGSGKRPLEDAYNSAHEYYYEITASVTGERFTWTDSRYTDNSGGLSFEFTKLVDTIRVCQSENSTILTEYVVGTNLKWYTSEKSEDGTPEVPDVNNNVLGYTEYWVTQSNDECESERTPVKYLVKPNPVVNLGNDTTICKGDEITLDAQNSGLSFNWNTGGINQILSTSETGIYGVEVTTDLGCIGSDSMEVKIQDLPVVNLGDDQKICDGEPFELDAENTGSNYRWSTGESSQKIALTTSGVYSVEVTDDIGCLGTDEMELIVNPMPSINLGNDTTICFGESVTLDAQNLGFNYSWSTSELTQIIKVKTTKTVTVEVFDEIGCSDEDEINIIVNDLPIVDLGVDQKICDGQSVQLDAENPGLNYNWSNGENTQQITIDASGTYSVDVTDDIGCLGTDEIELIVNPMPVVNLGNDTAICIGETVSLNALNPGFNYVWNTGESTQTITISTTGNYEVRVYDEIGCADTSNMNLIVNELPVVNLGDDHVICEFERSILDAQNEGLNFIWTTSETSQTIEISEEGLYGVEVRDQIGCLGTDDIYITKELIDDPYLEKEKIICEGTSIILEPDFINDYTIFWENDKANSTLEVTETGAYESIVVSEFCRDTFTVNVEKIDTPNAVITDIKAQGFYCFEYETTTLAVNSNDEGSVNFEWDDFGTTEEVEINAPGTYALTATNRYCSARYTKTINEYCKGLFFVPNAFTPGNGDGLNDVFKAETNGYVDGFEFRVFNRWGDLIYYTNKQGEGWDGSYNGNQVQIDVYNYRLTYNYQSENGGIERKDQIGTVTLFR